MSCGRRALLLYEGSRSGPAILTQATALLDEEVFELTVVALAPQDTDPPCCAVYTDAYNRGVRDDVATELGEAELLLGPYGARVRFELLVEGRDPPLETLVPAGEIDLVLLPARSRIRRAPYHPLEQTMRRSTGAEVRVVSPPPHRGRHTA